MKSLSRLVVVSAVSVFIWLSIPGSRVGAATLPAVHGSGYKTVEGPKGGRMIFAREPSVSDPIAALHAAGRTYFGYFQAQPTIESVIESTDHRGALATFTIRQRGVSVAGILIAAIGSNGAQLVALIDRPERLRESAGPMIAVLNGSPSASTSVADAHTFTFADNTGSVSVPAGWRVAKSGQGLAIVVGPKHQSAVMDLILNLVVPGRAPNGLMPIVVPFQADPAAVFTEAMTALARSGNSMSDIVITKRKEMSPDTQGWQREYIEGTDLSATHERESFAGIVTSSPLGSAGVYTLTIEDLVTSPDAYLRESAPILLGILQSYRVNGKVLSAQLQEQSRAVSQLSSAMVGGAIASSQAESRAAHESQEAIDRSTSGFVHYLNESDVVEHIGSGDRGSVDAGFAQAMVNGNPQAFRIVPMSQYRAGD